MVWRGVDHGLCHIAVAVFHLHVVSVGGLSVVDFLDSKGLLAIA